VLLGGELLGGELLAALAASLVSPNYLPPHSVAGPQGVFNYGISRHKQPLNKFSASRSIVPDKLVNFTLEWPIIAFLDEFVSLGFRRTYAHFES
jgi:hypothetical protein